MFLINNDIQKLVPFNKLSIKFFVRFWNAPFNICLKFFFRFSIASILLVLIYKSYAEFAKSFIWQDEIDYSFDIKPSFIYKYVIDSLDFIVFVLMSGFIVFIKEYDNDNAFILKQITLRIVVWIKKIFVLCILYFLPISIIYLLSDLLNLFDVINSNFAIKIILNLFLFTLLSLVAFAPLLLLMKSELSVVQSIVVGTKALYANAVYVVLFVLSQLMLLVTGLFCAIKLLDFFMVSYQVKGLFTYISYFYLYGVFSVLFIELFDEK
ncbi:hypothetical protein [Marinicellulosiphila megalodicopiae]|uniref:hypothetical protein n=1 Tax=Marinicellulosiphila megalodicopiae TaxID=2724896 RepID=UPI003BAF4E9B